MLTLRPLGSEAQPQSPRGIQLKKRQPSAPIHVNKSTLVDDSPYGRLGRGIGGEVSWREREREPRNASTATRARVPSKISLIK